MNKFIKRRDYSGCKGWLFRSIEIGHSKPVEKFFSDSKYEHDSAKSNAAAVASATKQKKRSFSIRKWGYEQADLKARAFRVQYTLDESIQKTPPTPEKWVEYWIKTHVRA